MKKHRIVILDSVAGSYVDNPQLEADILSSIGTVELVKVSSPNEAKTYVKDATGIISWHLVPLTQELIAQMHQCRAIVRAAVGFNNIDLDAIKKQRIMIANVPDYGTEEVADHTMTLLLSFIRKVKLLDTQCSSNGWGWSYMGKVGRIRGKTLGLVGLGRIGKAVAVRARVFGMKVAFYDPYVESGIDKAMGITRIEHIEELLLSSDYLSLHVPLNQATHHLINNNNKHFIKDGAIIVNTCRGSVISEQTLINLLEMGRISGVGLDVLEHEPLIPDILRGKENVLLSGHGAFFADEALIDLRTKAATTLGQILTTSKHRDILDLG